MHLVFIWLEEGPIYILRQFRSGSLNGDLLSEGNFVERYDYICGIFIVTLWVEMSVFILEVWLSLL